MQEVLALLAEYGYENIEEVETAKEDILFSLPKELRAALKTTKTRAVSWEAAGQNPRDSSRLTRTYKSGSDGLDLDYDPHSKPSLPD